MPTARRTTSRCQRHRSIWRQPPANGITDSRRTKALQHGRSSSTPSTGVSGRRFAVIHWASSRICAVPPPSMNTRRNSFSSWHAVRTSRRPNRLPSSLLGCSNLLALMWSSRSQKPWRTPWRSPGVRAPPSSGSRCDYREQPHSHAFGSTSSGFDLADVPATWRDGIYISNARRAR